MADSNQPPEKPRPREPEGQEFQRDGHVSGGSRRFRTPSGRPPPPERSTPRLGRHRRSPPEARVPRRPPGFAESRPEAPAPPLLENLAERRVLPPERSTPRLGAKWRNGAEDEPPAVSRAEAPEATASETEAAESSLAARTVLTERRKEQLVARAADEPHEALYDSVGVRTHLHLLTAADERSRQSWVEVSMPERSRRSRRRAPNTRWIPPVLVAVGAVILAVGFWIWHQKVQRLQASGTTPSKLPSAQYTTTFAASPVEGSPAPKPSAASPVPIRSSETALSDQPRSDGPSPQPSRSDAAQPDEPRGDGAAPEPVPAPARSGRSKPAVPSDQGIFKEAPF